MNEDRNPFPKVRMIRTAEERDAAIAAAKADNDAMIFPTHIVERNGEIIGASSLAAIPLMLQWSHSEKLKARDSLSLKRVYDGIMEAKGFPTYFIACNKRSPYSAHMKGLGFTSIWETEIFQGGV